MVVPAGGGGLSVGKKEEPDPALVVDAQRWSGRSCRGGQTQQDVVARDSGGGILADGPAQAEAAHRAHQGRDRADRAGPCTAVV